MLSTSEQAALAVFRSFMVNAGEMLCFHGPQLEKHGPTLRQLAEKNLVIKEQFAGGYSLTRAGFEAMAGPHQPRAAQPKSAPPKAAPPKTAQTKAAKTKTVPLKSRPAKAAAALPAATQPAAVQSRPARKPARASHSPTRR